MRAKRGERLPHALSVRDAALSKVCAEGTHQEPGGLWWEGGDLTMAYLGPSQPVLVPNPQPLDRGSKLILPYWLDIWDPHRKVFSIKWDDTGLIDLARFTRGEWERVVLGFAQVLH